MTDKPSWNADEESESDWDCQPYCPKCRYAHVYLHDAMEEGADEGEIECDCGLTLKVYADFSCSYQLRYEPPSEADIAEAYSDMLTRVRRRLRWDAREPERRRDAEAKARRKSMVASDWESYTWPDWIPGPVRALIQSFWSSAGRGPFEWLENSRVGEPKMGEQVSLAVGSCNEVHGQYVHAWNDIGCVVDSQGGEHQCSGQASCLLSFQESGRSSKPALVAATTSLTRKDDR